MTITHKQRFTKDQILWLVKYKQGKREGAIGAPNEEVAKEIAKIVKEKKGVKDVKIWSATK